MQTFFKALSLHFISKLIVNTTVQVRNITALARKTFHFLLYFPTQLRDSCDSYRNIPPSDISPKDYQEHNVTDEILY